MSLMNVINNTVEFITNKKSDKVNEKVVKKELSLHDKISKHNYLELKNLNKLYSCSARSIREAAIRNKGQVRGHLRFLKNQEGQIARIYHVSLCFLKGKKYSEVEPNVENKNRLTINQIENQLYYKISREYAPQLKADIQKFLEL